jgi:hypothetical protein
MSNFQQFNESEMQSAAQRLQAVANGLAKSFSAGTPGAANAERSGLAAMAIEDLSQDMESLTLEDEDFILTKDIKIVPAKQTLYEYVVKNGAGVDVDVWGMENFLPQESAANYRRVYEPIKVMGIRKSISHLAQTVNDAGGYMMDLEQENEKNALLTLGNATERAGYNGGDLFIDASGSIDATIASNPNGPTRQFRGIQAQIREGNYDVRGISQDFRGYANNRATIDDAKGGALSRTMLDKICTAINGNKGKAVEAHATPEQLRLFRQQFFSMDRGDVSSAYAIRGANVSTEQKSGFMVDTTSGALEIKSTFMKNEMIFAVPMQGSAGSAPAAPGVITSAQSAGSTSYAAGDVIRYIVQSVNFSGRSSNSAEVAVTITASGNNVSLTIPYVAGCEYFKVFRLEAGETAKLTADGVTSHRFIGNVVASRINTQSTTFIDAQAVLPGLNSIVFLPKPERRAVLACIGPRVAKIDFGIRGLASEKGYVSYCAIILKLPRQHGLVQNVQEEISF